MRNRSPISVPIDRNMPAISMLSASMVAYEILLMYFFNIVQWHHFASMVISMALLGFGASGSVLTLWRKQVLQRAEILLPLLMIGTGLLMTLVLRLSRAEFLLFDSYTLFVDRGQFARLLGTYLLFFLPFFTGAMAIGILFVSKVSGIGRYYFSDLLGSGTGGLLVIGLLWTLPLEQAPAAIAALPLAAGMLLVGKQARKTLYGFGLLAAAITVYMAVQPIDIRPSPYKAISYAMQLPEVKIEAERSSPYGYLQVLSSPVQRYAPGLSLTYSGVVPASPAVFKNGNWYASVPDGFNESRSVLEHTTMHLPLVLRVPHSTLVFNAGAGFETAHLLQQGAGNISAVEPDAILVQFMHSTLARQTDSLFFNPALTVHVTAPRSFLNQTESNYDLILFPVLGSFGGSVGLDALEEANLLTREAFREMWDKLTPQGMIAISCWMDMPPRIPLRISSLLSASLEESGIVDPRMHLAVIKSWGTISFVLSKSQLQPSDTERVLAFCETNGFDAVLLPGIVLDQSAHNRMDQEEVLFLTKDLFGEEREALVATYDFNVNAPTDDRPYFFQFLRISNMAEHMEQFGSQSAAFLELGYLIALVTLLQVTLFAVLFILVPLWRIGWQGKQKVWVLFYFSGLGMGYMLAEVIWIKYFVLYLGHPIYSVAMVISVMLMSSGLGSLYSSRFHPTKKALSRITLAITVAILAYSLFLGGLLSTTVGWEPGWKMAVSIGALAIPSFFMGMPFPMGMKVVDNQDKAQVPWAWGVNGSVSVISTALAAVLAVETGFTAVMLLAALSYASAFLAVLAKKS